MTRLRFYGGISTIGGNCIVIEEDETRIMLDNGMCFSKENAFYKDFLNPRTNNDLRDYLDLGLVPKIPGIYGRDKIRDVCASGLSANAEYLFKRDLISYEDYLEEHGAPYLSAFFLTHCHLDHLRNVKFMSPEIPIYCSAITKSLLKIIENLSNEDFLCYKKPQIKELKSGYTPGELCKKKSDIERKIHIIKPREIIEVPKSDLTFKIKAHPVDHSVPGAMAFEIFTKAGKRIIYTGDIRFHGHEHEKAISEEFLTEAQKNPDVLITEGTRIDDNQKMSEDDVFNNMLNFLHKDEELSCKLIIAAFPWKSITRFHTLYKVARQLNRCLVIQAKLAFTIHNLQHYTSLNLRNILHNDDLKIYLPRKRSMIYSDADYSRNKYNVSYTTEWSKNRDIELYSDLYDDILIRAYEINEQPSDYVIQLNFYDLNELIDIKPPEGSYLFNLKTEPFDEEGEFEEKVLMNWVHRFGLHYEKERYHASGHASGDEILAMINQLKPKKVFPIHTEHPELFQVPNVIKDIEQGKPYFI
ncbi:MAG: hypothetical protein BAJALOKI3v1_570017 [Promethearchaeota archaeon]|nr:MAG: hypothetical protein BAJALOKI3v1_570017 [Candidatus Lokiarchaeota archaeon]